MGAGSRRANERASLDAIDRGYAAYTEAIAEGATSRSRRAVRVVDDRLSRSFFDWIVSDNDLSVAARTLFSLRTAEFVYAIRELNQIQYIDPINGGYHTKSGFMFEGRNRGRTMSKLSAFKNILKKKLRNDPHPKALKTALDIFETQYKKLWNE